jgi:transcriptional regulator with XRE-family HTH domain
MSFMATVFSSLRTIRTKRKASLASYAKKVGVSIGQLSRIERGLIGSLDITTALRISDVYGLPLEAWRKWKGAAA